MMYGFATDLRDILILVRKHPSAFQRPLKAEIDTIYWMDAVRVLPPKQAFMPSWCKSCVAKMKGGEILIYHNNRITAISDEIYTM